MNEPEEEEKKEPILDQPEEESKDDPQQKSMEEMRQHEDFGKFYRVSYEEGADFWSE